MPRAAKVSRSDINVLPCRLASKPAYKFVVTGPGKAGQRRWRKFFEVRAKAEAYAHLRRVDLENHGVKGAALSQGERAEYLDLLLPTLAARHQTVTVSKAMKIMLEAQDRDGASRRHVQDLRSRLGQFSRAFNGRTLASFTGPEIDAWLRALPVANLTRNNFRRVVSGLFAFGLQRGWCIENPVAKLSKAKVAPGKVGILTAEQTARLLHNAPADTVAALAIAAFCGLRRAELERLDWREVHMAKGLLEVTADKAKTARRRFIPIRELGGAFRRPGLNPGELTRAHATQAQKCGDCHSVEQNGALTLAAFTTPRKRALADSALCLKCHALGDQPLNPHGIASGALAELDRNLQQKAGPGQRPALLRVSQTLSGIDPHASEMACSTCHQEHQGREFDLKRLSNTQCQTCHSVQFASFEDGHPDFAEYPYRRRTRIFFDHNSHLQQHFGEMKEKAPGSCQDCHVTDPNGRFMEVKNFETACAACHGPQIQGEGMTVKGAAFFTVPGLDLDTLAAKGISVGEWPKLADGKMTPFMEFLLSREPGNRAAIQKLRGIDLNDLSKAAPEQLAAAEQLAWGIKNLLFNLVTEGQSALAEPANTKSAAGEPLTAGLAGELSRRVVLVAQREWMPDLLTEVPNYRQGIKPPLPIAPKAAPAPAATPAPQKPAASGDESLLGGDDLAPKASPPPKTDKGTVKSAPKPADDDLAGAADVKPASSPSPAPSLSASSKSDDLSETDLAGPSAASPPATPPPAVAAPAEMPAEDWMAAGGWYRPTDSFTIFYRPSGHADVFLMAWLTAAARATQTDSGPNSVFAQLADPQAPGVCMKCHTADVDGSAIAVNWRPAHNEPTTHPFTTFWHAAHFSLTGDNGCQTCHALNPKSDYARYFTAETASAVNSDPHRFQSNFLPLSKATCVQCHRPADAGDGCLLCHEYHAGAFTAKSVLPGKMLNVARKTP